MDKQKIRILFLPEFELLPVAGDTPGEAPRLYGGDFRGEEGVPVRGGYPGSRLYVRGGLALYLTGMGKVNAAASVTALLADERYDFSESFIISTGCAGGAYGRSVMGDVYVVTSAVDYDIGHHADIRDMEDGENTVTWFHDASYDDVAYTHLDRDLTARVYGLVKELPMETTPRTERFMRSTFPGEAWAEREPRVLRGTTVSGDNFWKGMYGHANADRMTERYGCPDPYMCSEMEDAAIGAVLRRYGYLSRYIVIRACVNMDVFMNGDTPEKLWRPGYRSTEIAGEDNPESADIFPTAMDNCFRVLETVTEAILEGKM